MPNAFTPAVQSDVTVAVVHVADCSSGVVQDVVTVTTVTGVADELEEEAVVVFEADCDVEVEVAATEDVGELVLATVERVVGGDADADGVLAEPEEEVVVADEEAIVTVVEVVTLLDAALLVDALELATDEVPVLPDAEDEGAVDDDILALLEAAATEVVETE